MEVFFDVSAMWREWRRIGLASRVYAGQCAGSRSVGKPWNRCINAVKDCLRKRD